MQIFQIHRGKGTDAYYLQQFRNDNVSKAAAFYCKYRMFSYNICLTLYTALITVNVEDICIETFFLSFKNLFLKFQDHNQLHTHSVRLLWTCNSHVAGAATHTTHTRDVHPCHRRDSNPQSQQSSDCRSRPYTVRPLDLLSMYRVPAELTTAWVPLSDWRYLLQRKKCCHKRMHECPS
jgi:hypothetical protein